jgi:hypothetical protein
MGTFSNCGLLRMAGMGEIDNDVSCMVNTTVKYLVENLRVSEASPDTQKQFTEMIFLSCIYDLRTRYLGRATSQALRQAVNSLRQDIEPRMTENWVDAGFPLPSGCFVPGIDVALSYPGTGPTARPGRHSRVTRLPLPPDPELCCPIHLRTSPHSKPLFKAHRHQVVMTD